MSAYVAKAYDDHFDILTPKDEYVASISSAKHAANLVLQLNHHSTLRHKSDQLSAHDEVVGIYCQHDHGYVHVADVETDQEADRLLQHLNRNNRPQGA